MYYYCVARPVTLYTRSQSMTLIPAADAAHPSIGEMYLAAQNELDAVRKALAQAYPSTPVDELLYLYKPNNLPALLGSRVYVETDSDVPSGCLTGQLARLKTLDPLRQHYRLLLINGFGTNLGDNLIGLTAFSHVLARIRSVLPSVSVDVMLGWHEDNRLERLYRDAEGIDGVLTRGMSLCELTRYQGIFDCGELLAQPRYGTIPMVDWYLWWMGIDPSCVADTEKRNRVSLPESVRGFAAASLGGDGVRVVINPKASVPLRSMPEAALRRLIDYLLRVWPEVRIILVQPLVYEHPNVRDLSSQITDIDCLAAIIAECDALIGVDTYTQHVCDATATPAVTLYTSVLPELYPYYPLIEPLMLPAASHLPAWGKMKVSPGVWKIISHFYDAAWMTLEPETILSALRRTMARKGDSPINTPALICYPNPIKAGDIPHSRCGAD